VIQLVAYCVLIVAASLLGGWLPTLVTLTHKRMQVMMSTVGGLMLGIALFHMLPHALHELGPERYDFVTGCVMVGLLTMFFLLRTFHFHHHDTAVPEEVECQGAAQAHDHPHEHHHHDHHHHGAPHGPHDLSWLGVFLGLGLHTLIDGIALAASVQSDLASAAGGIWPLHGAGTFLAILVHKPLDAVSITSLMTARHWSVGAKLAVSAAFAAMCPLGATLFMLGLGRFSGIEQLVLGGALAFSAGVFLCISLSDLLPEMEFHSHHRLLLSGALLAGIAAAWLLHWLEPLHAHPPGRPPAAAPGESGREPTF
jgi:zinc and cadmium transporter